MATILACADVHIGRRSAGLPADLAAELTPAAAWARLVDLALRRRVDALVVCGDLAEEANAYYEALAPLERSARALADAGVPLVAVAGNHDWDVLGRLSEAVPGAVTVLGRGGRWEHRDIAGRDGVGIRLFGWSFPERAVTVSPLAGFPREELVLGGASIGLLHADLNATGGRYCPVSRGALDAVPLAGWLLGHLHQPTPPAAAGGTPFVVCTGSLQGLDGGPGEGGPHGAWEVEASAAGVETRFLPLAAVQYDPCTVDLNGADTTGEVQVRLMAALRDQAAAAQRLNPALRCLVLRLCLGGRTAVPREVLVEQLQALQQAADLGTAARIVLEAWALRTLPLLDLEALRAAPTPLGAAVRLWHELTGAEGLSPASQAALGALQERLAEHAARAYPDLGPAHPDVGFCRELLAEQAEGLIEALHAQKAVADA